MMEDGDEKVVDIQDVLNVVKMKDLVNSFAKGIVRNRETNKDKLSNFLKRIRHQDDLPKN